MFITIIGFEKYSVNEFGEIRNNKTMHVLKPLHRAGYLYVTLKGKKLLIHRLVYCTLNKLDVLKFEGIINHIDGNKKNNNYSNLEKSTYSDNIKHAYNTGLRKRPCGKLNTQYGKRGKLNYASKLLDVFKLDGLYIGSFYGVGEAIRKLNLNKENNSNIYRLLKNKKGNYKTAYGYIWKYR